MTEPTSERAIELIILVLRFLKKLPFSLLIFYERFSNGRWQTAFTLICFLLQFSLKFVLAFLLFLCIFILFLFSKRFLLGSLSHSSAISQFQFIVQSLHNLRVDLCIWPATFGLSVACVCVWASVDEKMHRLHLPFFIHLMALCPFKEENLPIVQ